MSYTVEEQESYSDGTPLTKVYGDSARVKIIAALLSERDHDLNVSDIARLAGVARSTVYDNIDELEELGVVVNTREVGGGPMYQINTDSEIVEYTKRVEGLALERVVEGGL